KSEPRRGRQAASARKLLHVPEISPALRNIVALVLLLVVDETDPDHLERDAPWTLEVVGHGRQGLLSGLRQLRIVDLFKTAIAKQLGFLVEDEGEIPLGFAGFGLRLDAWTAASLLDGNDLDSSVLLKGVIHHLTQRLAVAAAGILHDHDVGLCGRKARTRQDQHDRG